MINGCGRKNKYQMPINSNQKTSNHFSSDIKNINVLIENSGSMQGFLNLSGIANKTIHDLGTSLTKVYPDSKIKFYLIDSRGEMEFDIKNFRTIPIQVNGSKTLIPDMLERVINQTRINSLNIFISDFIYANGVGSPILNNYRNDVNQVFDKYKSDLLVYQLFSEITSKYPGIYFTNSLTSFPNRYAPFYLFVFGNKEALQVFDNNISKSFVNPADISIRKKLFEKNENNNNSIKYKIAVGSRASIGSIGIRQGVSNSLTEIVNMKRGRGSDKVQFSVLFSNSSLFISDRFIENIDNYIIKPSYFKLEQVKKYNDPNGFFSHEMVISTTKIMNDTLSIKLKELLSNTDANIVTNPYTTFGFDYLVRGLKDSYSPIISNDKSQFEIEIPIHLKSSNSFGIFLLIVSIFGIPFLFYKLKFNKRKSK